MSDEILMTAPKKRAVRKRAEPSATTNEAVAQLELPTTGPQLSKAMPNSNKEKPGSAEDGNDASRVFLLAVLVGFGLALLGLIDNPILHWLGFFAPIGATIAYPIWGFCRGFHKRPSLRERFGDNCYYLGFIFTQIALVVGFLPVALFNDEIGSQDVLRFFGTALGASLTGLLARTLLTQTGHTVTETQDIIEAEVETLARHVTQQAKIVLSEFEGLAAGLSANQQRLNEQFSASIEALTGTVGAYDAAFRRDAVAMEQGVAAVASATSMTVADLTHQQETLAASLSAAARAIESLQHGLHVQVSETSGAIRATAEALTTGLGSLQGISRLAGRLDDVDASLAKIGGRIESFEGVVDRTHHSADASLQSIDALVAEARSRAVESASALSVEMNDTAAALEKTLTAFRGELERLRV